MTQVDKQVLFMFAMMLTLGLVGTTVVGVVTNDWSWLVVVAVVGSVATFLAALVFVLGALAERVFPSGPRR